MLSCILQTPWCIEQQLQKCYMYWILATRLRLSNYLRIHRTTWCQGNVSQYIKRQLNLYFFNYFSLGWLFLVRYLQAITKHCNSACFVKSGMEHLDQSGNGNSKIALQFTNFWAQLWMTETLHWVSLRTEMCSRIPWFKMGKGRQSQTSELVNCLLYWSNFYVWNIQI